MNAVLLAMLHADIAYGAECSPSTFRVISLFALSRGPLLLIPLFSTKRGGQHGNPVPGRFAAGNVHQVHLGRAESEWKLKVATALPTLPHSSTCVPTWHGVCQFLLPQSSWKPKGTKGTCASEEPGSKPMQPTTQEMI